jgi:hypothetical protein
LIKEDILHLLDFSKSDYYISCIKGNYVNQIKKWVKRSAGILEIIHMDICDSFPIKYVDGYDLFITFIDDFCAMATFIQLKNDRKYWINLRYLRLK